MGGKVDDKVVKYEVNEHVSKKVEKNRLVEEDKCEK